MWVRCVCLCEFLNSLLETKSIGVCCIFFNRILCEVVCSRIRLVAFDCCFALGRLDGLLIHSFINFIIIIIWWLAEGITMVLLLRNGIRLMVFFFLLLREIDLFMDVTCVCVISTCMISLSSNHFSLLQLEQTVFYVLWLISCGWIFMINSSQANDAVATLSKPVCHSRIIARGSKWCSKPSTWTNA